MSVSIRPLVSSDGSAALALYTELTYGPDATDLPAFDAVLDHPGTQVFGAFEDDSLIAMVTLHVLPNVTWGARPYALVENVITTSSKQNRGVGKQLLQYAVDHAWANNVFKIMLLTGKERAAHGFYESVGFRSDGKTAMVLRRL